MGSGRPGSVPILKGIPNRAPNGGIRHASEAADLNPPQQPKVRYRLLYRAANGVAGPPFPEAEVRFELYRRCGMRKTKMGRRWLPRYF
ncbi:MAG: hypothetical protein JW828_05130 [Sedimentisphaerales bacterium]|nr:hypothetical protein [Sedimentisphaerales bacterium]